MARDQEIVLSVAIEVRCPNFGTHDSAEGAHPGAPWFTRAIAAIEPRIAGVDARRAHGPEIHGRLALEVADAAQVANRKFLPE